MWIEEKANGKYKYTERYTDYLTGQKKRVSVTLDKNTAQSRKLAQRTLNEMIAASYSKTSIKEYSLKELVDAYQKEQLLTVKQSTYTRNFHALNTIMKMPLRQVLKSHILLLDGLNRFPAVYTWFPDVVICCGLLCLHPPWYHAPFRWDSVSIVD